jgi:AcrR family transcriptional regulator
MPNPTALRITPRQFVPPPAPKTPKSQGTRRRLLDLAARLFIERGYGALSMRDLASEAGMTKGAVYGHFRSKGQLLVEVIRWRLAEIDAATDYGSVVADPERGVELIYQDRGRDLRVLEVDAAAAARHDPDVAAGLADLYRERHARICDALSEATDPDTAAWLVGVLTAGVGMRESIGMPLPRDDRLRTTLLAAILAATEVAP